MEGIERGSEKTCGEEKAEELKGSLYEVEDGSEGLSAVPGVDIDGVPWRWLVLVMESANVEFSKPGKHLRGFRIW